MNQSQWGHGLGRFGLDLGTAALLVMSGCLAGCFDTGTSGSTEGTGDTAATEGSGGTGGTGGGTGGAGGATTGTGGTATGGMGGTGGLGGSGGTGGLGGSGGTHGTGGVGGSGGTHGTGGLGGSGGTGGMGGSGGTGGGSATPAMLACFRWNEDLQQEIMYRLDPVTGQTTDLGIVGDLTWWGGITAAAPDGDVVYVDGIDVTMQQHSIYVMSASTGALLDQIPTTESTSGLEVAPDGTLLYGRWNGAEEELVRLDPVSKTTQVIGTIGDLGTWSGVTAVDQKGGVIYTLGQDAASAPKTYVNNALSGAFIGTEAPLAGYGLQVDGDGDLLRFDWNGASEDMIKYDPVTNTDTVLGTVGDLYVWSGVTAIDVAGDRIYVVGSNEADLQQNKLYTLDTETGALLGEVPLQYQAYGCVAN